MRKQSTGAEPSEGAATSRSISPRTHKTMEPISHGSQQITEQKEANLQILETQIAECGVKKWAGNSLWKLYVREPKPTWKTLDVDGRSTTTPDRFSKQVNGLINVIQQQSNSKEILRRSGQCRTGGQIDFVAKENQHGRISEGRLTRKIQIGSLFRGDRRSVQRS